MDVYQVEQYYLYTNNQDIDFDKAKELCEEYDLTFNQDGDTAYIETFDSEGEASEFGEILQEKCAR